jgi:23S rRNA (guanosine2251-2'-O)-methyltransferase
MKEENLIFGMRAVIEAIEAGKEIEKIFLQKGLSNELYHQLRKALHGNTIPIQIVPPEKLKRISEGNHQGVIAYLTEINYFVTEELLATVFEKGKIPLILILDRITDVRNFGAIARGAECAGVDFIIIPSRGAAQINGDAIKTSAGALHRMKVCREDNLKNTIEYLKTSGLQIVSCHEKTETLIYEADFKQPTAIIMGSEENGISNEYLKRCDVQVKIPMVGKIASLNVSVATGIVLFEVVKQRL